MLPVSMLTERHGESSNLGPSFFNACGLWQLCLHKLGPCGFSAFFYVTLVTHVTPRDVRVPGLPQLITSRHRLGMSHLVQDVEAKRQVRYRSR